MKNQSSGAKTVPKRNSCEYLLFTGVIFLPAFDLFDLFSTFRITMILQFQTDRFHNFLSGFIIKLIERCKQIIYIRHTVLTEKVHQRMLRKQFLKKYRSARYQYLLLIGKLTEHLNQIDQESREQVEMLMEQMAEKQGVTEELKVQNQTKWVRLMNNIKASAEEMVLREILYI